MVDLTAGAKPLPGVDRNHDALRIWGENAVFCRDGHAPAWHHRAYHDHPTEGERYTAFVLAGIIVTVLVMVAAVVIGLVLG